MIPPRVHVLLCALWVGAAALPAPAADAPAVLVGCHCKKCYDPCEPVGPVRRFLRRVFLRPCPPAPVAVVAVPSAPGCAPPPPAFAPAPAPAAFAPPPAAFAPPPPAAAVAPPSPPAAVPAAPPAPAPFPAAGSAYRHAPQVLTPSAPPPPVRLDHMASRGASGGVQGQVLSLRKTPAARTQLLLVNVEQTRLRQYVSSDDEGRFRATLAPGGWFVYARTRDGDNVYQGRIEVRPRETTRLKVQAP